MNTRARARLEAPDPPTQHAPNAIVPSEHSEPPIDADHNLEDVPKEKRLQLAVAAVQGKLMSERAAADYYQVPRGTIQGRLKGALTHKVAHAHERKLNDAQEEILVEFVKVLGKRGMPLSLTTIGSYAADICGAPLGVTWAPRFKKRHNHELKVKWTTGLEECRARALNRPVVHDYFALLGDVIERYDVKTKNIYNMDEKGVQLGIGNRIAALVDRDQKLVQKIESGNRDLVTIIECVSADGFALRPSVVFQGQRRDRREQSL